MLLIGVLGANGMGKMWTTPTLSYSIWVVVRGFLFIWYTLGYAIVGYGFVNILGGQFWLEL